MVFLWFSYGFPTGAAPRTYPCLEAIYHSGMSHSPGPALAQEIPAASSTTAVRRCAAEVSTWGEWGVDPKPVPNSGGWMFVSVWLSNHVFSGPS